MNTSKSIIDLKATNVLFFSQCDEKEFFNWIDKLPFVRQYVGQGRTLYISIDSGAIDEDGLREILALFHRYRIEKKQLAVFDREEFLDWFHDKRSFWYDEIFG